MGKCRFCGSEHRQVMLSLGHSPLANSYLTAGQLQACEPFYPLDVYICESCYLVQLDEFDSPEHIFGDYAYFSSFSTSWLAHAKTYVERMIERFSLGVSSQVVEIASNDGYLLQYFRERGVPVLGIEPAQNVAEAALEKGIPTRCRFFSEAYARELTAEGVHADVIVGNNVLAHVPDLNDFVAGLKVLLAPHGVITMEFPHLYRLVEENQFDTIYHEHFSYFSFFVVREVFRAHGMDLFDVEELPTHGGSLRIFACHAGDDARPVTDRVRVLLDKEEASGMMGLEYYLGFGQKVAATKRDVLQFLIEAKDAGKRVVAYGAPAKGNTLLNYCGIRTDFIDYTVDRSPHKQGLYTPGVHLPIYAPERVLEDKPDYLFILPWNLKEEIMEQMAFVRDWGGRYVVPIPKVHVLE